MITKPILQEFRVDFDEAIKSLEEKYGFEIKLGRISYSDDSFNGKIEVFDKTKGESKEANEFEKYCHLYGLEREDLGKTIICNREPFKIVGLNPSKRKYCVNVVRLKDGKAFRLTVEATKDALKRVAI